MVTDSALYNGTKDLHHACEQHPVGGAMASGTPPKIWYAAWVMALKQIHNAIDDSLPESVHRVNRLQQDLDELELKLIPNMAAISYVNSLKDEKDLAGACYVLTGAHLMGGEVMRRRLEGFPTNHLLWDDRKEALAVLSELRKREDIVQEARNCFEALLNIMDEIQRVYFIKESE